MAISNLGCEEQVRNDELRLTQQSILELCTNCLESDSQDLLDEKKREACVQGKFVVKMYWLKEQDFHD